MGGLFGSSKTQVASAPVDVTPATLASIREPFSQVLRTLLGDPSASVSGGVLAGIPQSGIQPLAAPMAPGEQTALTALLGQIGGGRQALLDQTLSGAFATPETNPFLRGMIEAAQRPTLEGLTEALERTLPGRFTQAGQFVQREGSSAFDRAAALATRGAAQALGDIATNLSGQVYEAERGRQQQAIQLGQQEVQTTIANLQAQALPRLIENMGIERGLAEFQSRVQTLLQALAVATGAPLTTIGTAQASTSTTSPNIISTLLSPFTYRWGF